MRARLLALLLTLVALPYLMGLGGQFVWLDHLEIVEGALIVRTPAEALALFTNDGNFGGYHRPFYNLLHSLDVALFGLEPFGFHVTSLVLHLINVALAALLARAAGMGERAAFAVALLFGLHPVGTSVVGLIHSKADLFVTTMLAGSLVLCLRDLASPRRVARALSLVLFGVALLTKELAFVYPLGLLAMWLRAASKSDPEQRRRLAFYVVATAVLTLAVALLRLTATGSSGYDSPIGAFHRFLTFFQVYVDYLVKLVVPWKLSICDTTTAFSSLPALVRLGSSTLFVLLVMGQFALVSRFPRLFVWVLLFNLALLPVAQLVPILHFRADRFLYLPTLAVIGCAVEGLRLLAEYRPAIATKHVATGALAVVAVIYAALIVNRLPDFESDEALFTMELERTPDYLEGASSMARQLDRQGEFARAEPLWRQCLNSNPARLSYFDRGGLVVNFSFNLIAQGKHADAYALLVEFEEMPLSPRHEIEAGYNRAVAARSIGRNEEALAGLEAYAQLFPRDASCQYLMGVCATDLERWQVATTAFETYLGLAPEAPEREAVLAKLARLATELGE